MRKTLFFSAVLVLGLLVVAGCGKTASDNGVTDSGSDVTIGSDSGTSDSGTSTGTDDTATGTTEANTDNPEGAAEGGQASDGSEFSKAELDAKYGAAKDAEESVSVTQSYDDDINGSLQDVDTGN